MALPKRKRGGWVALHRSLLESAEWREATPQHRAVLIGVLLTVNHKTTKHYDADSGGNIIVKRGQLLTTVSALAELCCVSRSTVARALERYGERGTGFCSVKPHRRFSLISINKYDLYQAT